jgi:hypothetical protein
MDLTLAQVVNPEWTQSVIQLGGVGGCLIWFMFRSEPRLRQIEASIDRMARSIMLLVGSLPSANPAQKIQAEGIIREIDEAAAKRGDKNQNS